MGLKSRLFTKVINGIQRFGIMELFSHPCEVAPSIARSVFMLYANRDVNTTLQELGHSAMV